MNEKLRSFVTLFRGRRAFIPLLAGTAVLGTLLFLVFPPQPLPPVAATGGGVAANQGKGALRAIMNVASAGKTTNKRYLTLNPGDTIDLSPGPVSFGGHPELVSRLGNSWKYKARAPGHTVLTVGRGKRKRQVYLFVSPLASRQVGREDIDWYRTQYGTGYANCGPALVSMAILWSRGLDVAVQAIREEIGYPYDDGAVSFDNLGASLDRHHVPYTSPRVATPADLRRIVDRGHLAMVLIQSGAIAKVRGDPTGDLTGRYYEDDEGHYVLVKGYTLDKGFFVVYDPYPVDWESNSLRYGDEVSMIGKNRYYPAPQLFEALKTPMVLEVSAD